MMTLRKAEERGPTKIGWLDSMHSFSFGRYRDPRHMGFRSLLVINEDRVAPGAGFGEHGHADMEIISYVLEGALGHKDSTGTDGVIRPGEIQRMSAGSGIEHSEMNASATEPVHFLQIWIQPNQSGIAPDYEQVAMPPVTGDAQLDLIAGPDGGAGAVTLHADARIHRASLRPGAALDVPLAPGRNAWVQVARGDALANGQALRTGDGLALSDETRLTLAGGSEPAELLVFDLA
jgi:redox-sensitive bicupin YhaK (pirin superfamily)